MRLPNFEPKTKLQAKRLQHIIESIARYRNVRFLIFDVRDNPGGNSKYYRALLKNLYGTAYLRGLGKPFLWNQRWVQIWRASKENIQALEYKAPTIAKGMRKALDNHQKVFREIWHILSPKGNVSYHNPVKAKIAIVTNQRSYSSAWLFTRILKQLPNVTQLGVSTGINSYYSEPRTINLPHGLQMTFPMGANIAPSNDFGNRLQPSIVYHGNIYDDKKFIPWIINQLQEKYYSH